MASNASYCETIEKGYGGDLHAHYHDFEYGFPKTNDEALFGCLLMEINQAGLSWDIVLKKRATLTQAYAHFSITTLAHFSTHDVERLLANPGVIRMRKKIEAIVYNAQEVLHLQQEYGSFKAWLDHHHPIEVDQWIKLFKKHFKFTGKEITKEFLLATGYIEGAHAPKCPIYKKVLLANPPWHAV